MFYVGTHLNIKTKEGKIMIKTTIVCEALNKNTKELAVELVQRRAYTFGLMKCIHFVNIITKSECAEKQEYFANDRLIILPLSNVFYM